MTASPSYHLGVIAPPTNTVNEAEWRTLLPAHIDMTFVRMALHAHTDTPDGQQALRDDLAIAMEALAAHGADVMTYACTAGSMTTPHDTLPNWMRDTAGKPAITTAAAIVEALRYLDVRRVVVATPYHAALNHHETLFLEAAGFDVLAIDGLGIGAGGPHEYVQIARVPRDDIAAHIRSVMRDDAEAILVSCTDFPALSLIATLEAEFGIPVVSSNTATLWATLRHAGISAAIPGGRLFEPRNDHDLPL